MWTLVREKHPSQWYVDVDNSFAGFSLNDFKQVTYRSNDLKLDISVYT